MTHTFIPGAGLLLLQHVDTEEQGKHLEYQKGQLILVADVFYRDICMACRRLVSLLKSGRIKPKNVAFEYEQ